MTKKESLKCLWSVWDQWNLLGRVVLFPLVVPILIIITLLELLCSNDPWEK